MKKYFIAIIIFACVFAQTNTTNRGRAFDPGSVHDWKPAGRGNIQHYEGSHFLFHPDSTKVQLSLRYELFYDLNLGYTTIMNWDLLGGSAPFRDINHNPSLFYQFNFKSWFPIRYIRAILYEHKSNGRAGKDDRSYDSVGIDMGMRFRAKKIFSCGIDQEYYYIFRLSSKNKDLFEYIGWYDHNVFVSFAYYRELHDVTLNFRWYHSGYMNDNFSFSAGIALGFFSGMYILPKFYIEYGQGYAEFLLNYNEFGRSVRAGIIIEGL